MVRDECLLWLTSYVPAAGRSLIFLIDSQAAGALGEAGASGWIDTHFGERFLGAMMVGMIPDLSQAASGIAQNNRDSQTDYTANSRQAFADIAREAFF